MATEQSITVEARKAHSNSYGDKFEKAVGDRYDVPDPIQRQSLIGMKLVKAVAASSAAPAADPAA